jgi:hypothetical protein
VVGRTVEYSFERNMDRVIAVLYRKMSNKHQGIGRKHKPFIKQSPRQGKKYLYTM